MKSKGLLKKIRSHGVEAAGSTAKCSLYYFEYCYSQYPNGVGYNVMEGKEEIFVGTPEEVIEYARENNLKIYDEASFIDIPEDLKDKETY